jgi:O-antigen/teichoic acid export membrane protein
MRGARQNDRVIPSEARDATAPIPVSPRPEPGTPASAPAGGNRLKALASGWRAPQNRDGMALVLSSGLSSAVGLLYWVLAARMFDPATVGVNSTLVSTLALLGIVAQLNLGSAMLRFVPVVGRGARSLVALCYAIGIVAAVLIGTVFALGAGWWAPDLRAAVGAGALLAYFALSTPFWTVFNMQDYLLTGIKRATVVPFENLAFALLKIGLLVMGGLFGLYGAIAGSWALGTAVTVVAITIYLVRVLPPHQPRAQRPPTTFSLRVLSGFVAADWVGSMCLTLVNFGLPLLVFSRLGADSAATFNVTWQLAYALYLVPTGMGQSLVAHVASDPSELDAAHRQMVTKCLTLVVPAVVVLAAGSSLILQVFGEHYASTGSLLLALAALSAVPACVNLAAVAAARVSQQRVGQFGITLALAVIVIPAVWVLMPLWGLTGVGVALVGGQSVVAIAVLLLRRFGGRAARAA